MNMGATVSGTGLWDEMKGGRGEEVKAMNKSGRENQGEKKMLKRILYGGKGAVLPV